MPNTVQTTGTNVQPKSKNKNRVSKRQRHRRRNKQKLLNNIQNKAQSQPTPRPIKIPFSSSAQTRGAEVWGEAYVNAVRWHGEHQNNFWRHAAEQLQNENQMLRQQLHYVANIKPETQQLCYETSDEEEETIVVKKEEDEENEDEVDSKYLEFLQVTIKHREELRLKREAADLLEEEGYSTNGTVD